MDFFFKNPIVGISTEHFGKFFEDVELSVNNSTFKVCLKEIKWDEQSPTISNDYKFEGNLKDSNEGSSNRQDASRTQRDSDDDISAIADSFHSHIRDGTPKGTSRTVVGEAESSEEGLVQPSEARENSEYPFLWEARENSNSSCHSKISTANDSNSLLHSQSSYHVSDDLLGSMVPKLVKMKMGNRRGRPRKFPNRIVKAFQLPRSSKKKTLLRQINRDINKEAENVLESSICMGLAVEGNKEEVLAVIADRLKG